MPAQASPADGKREDAAAEDVNTRTIFVRNLAFSTTHKKLEDLFSVVGPVRQAFIVGENESKGQKHKGYGFVKFALEADANRALEEKQGVDVDGRKIKIEIAKRRTALPKGQMRERMQVADSSKDKISENGRNDRNHEDNSYKNEKKRAVKNKLEKNSSARTVAFWNIADTNKFQSLIKSISAKYKINSADYGNLCDSEFRRLDHEKGVVRSKVGVIAMKSIADAINVVRLFHKEKLGGNDNISARQLGGEGAKHKRWKIIIRNLAFEATPSAILAAIEPISFVWRIDCHKGYAFVSFMSKLDASKVIEKLNLKEIAGRPVAIDWALAKNVYESARKSSDEVIGASTPHKEVPLSFGNTTSKNSSSVSAVNRARRSDNGHDDDDDADDSDNENSDEHDDEVENDDNADSKIDFKDESEIMQSALKLVLNKGKNPSEGENIEQNTGQSRSGMIRNAASISPGDEMPAKERELGAPRNSGSNSNESTVFVFGLSQAVESSDLLRAFETFGQVKEVRVVKDPATGRPKGTAFVEYYDPTGATAATQESSRHISVTDRDTGKYLKVQIKVAKALTRDDAQALMKTRNAGKNKGNKRNLHLAKEGLIDEKSTAAQGMSKSDSLKRRRLEMEKKTKLANPNFFVSPTRLMVQNIPENLEEKELKHLFVRAVKQHATKENPRVVHAKILRDKVRTDESGNFKSIGRGFVEFSDAGHAIVALRALNNNPSTWSKEKRPIVQFAIENQKILQKRERIREKKINQQSAQAEEPLGKSTKEKSTLEKKPFRRKTTKNDEDDRKIDPNSLGEDEPSLPLQGQVEEQKVRGRKRMKTKGSFDKKAVEGVLNTSKVPENREEDQSVRIKGKKQKGSTIMASPATKRLGTKIDEGRNRVRKRHREEADDLDHLVTRYRKQIARIDFSDMKKQTDSKRWFE